MKTKLKRVLASVLTTVMLFTLIPVAGLDLTVKAGSKTIEQCSVGEIIEFGSYPQSEVKDSETIDALDAIDKEWISYGYYYGTGNINDGIHIQSSDYMKYYDLNYNGNKYRAVFFSKYRPWFTCYLPDSLHSYQKGNGYLTGEVYYFKFEPLTWKVIDPENGLIICTRAIDSQPYNNYIYTDDTDIPFYVWECYGDSTKKFYASDWAHSSLRTWLNGIFYETAFSYLEAIQIGETFLENKRPDFWISGPTIDDTFDKVFLLSKYDLLKTEYGFSVTDKPEVPTKIQEKLIKYKKYME